MSYHVIFVNGIRHTKKEAEKVCKELSDYLNCEVTLHYNPTGISDVITFPEELSTYQCVSDLKELLIASINKGNQILLILHSKGAHIGFWALSEIHSVLLKEHVTVHAYGGVVLIPKFLGKNVYNTLQQGDSIAIAGGQHLQSTCKSLLTEFIKTWADTQTAWERFKGTISTNKLSDKYNIKTFKNDVDNWDNNPFKCHSFPSYMPEILCDFKKFIKEYKELDVLLETIGKHSNGCYSTNEMGDLLHFYLRENNSIKLIFSKSDENINTANEVVLFEFILNSLTIRDIQDIEEKNTKFKILLFPANYNNHWYLYYAVCQLNNNREVELSVYCYNPLSMTFHFKVGVRGEENLMLHDIRLINLWNFKDRTSICCNCCAWVIEVTRVLADVEKFKPEHPILREHITSLLIRLNQKGHSFIVKARAQQVNDLRVIENNKTSNSNSNILLSNVDSNNTSSDNLSTSTYGMAELLDSAQKTSKNPSLIQKLLQQSRVSQLNQRFLKIEFNNLQNAKQFVAELLKIDLGNRNMPNEVKKIEAILADPNPNNNNSQDRYAIELTIDEWNTLQQNEQLHPKEKNPTSLHSTVSLLTSSFSSVFSLSSQTSVPASTTTASSNTSTLDSSISSNLLTLN